MSPETLSVITSLAIGLGLSAACGFRVFVPFLIMSLAAKTGHLTLASGFDWIGSTPALIAFATATGLEIAAYYVPWVDNLLDSVSTPSAVVAGVLVTASQVTDMDPLLGWSVAIVGGGGAAGVVQGLTTVTRGLSSLATGGIANPLVSTAEAGASIFLSALAILVPLVAVLALLLLLYYGAKKLFFRRREAARAPA